MYQWPDGYIEWPFDELWGKFSALPWNLIQQTFLWHNKLIMKSCPLLFDISQYSQVKYQSCALKIDRALSASIESIGNDGGYVMSDAGWR